MENYDPKKDCCPPFDPALWDGKTFRWNKKKFITDRVFTLFFMPMNFGQVVTRMNLKIDAAGGKALDWMSLSDHTSKWNMDLYIAVDKEIPGAKNITLSGTMLSKVYEGNFKDTGKWCKEFEAYAKTQGYAAIKKWYMWYTTCPKCAKKYGKNYVVIFGRV